MDRISELKSNPTFGQFVGQPEVIWPSHSEISTEKSACGKQCPCLASILNGLQGKAELRGRPVLCYLPSSLLESSVQYVDAEGTYLSLPSGFYRETVSSTLYDRSRCRR